MTAKKCEVYAAMTGEMDRLKIAFREDKDMLDEEKEKQKVVVNESNHEKKKPEIIAGLTARVDSLRKAMKEQRERMLEHQHTCTTCS